MIGGLVSNQIPKYVTQRMCSNYVLIYMKKYLPITILWGMH